MSSLWRQMLMVAVIAGVQARGAVAAPVMLELPELTTALDGERQVVVQLSLRVGNERLATALRQQIPRARHLLVMTLADKSPLDFQGDRMDLVADEYRRELNRAMGWQNGVRRVFFTKLVVQNK